MANIVKFTSNLPANKEEYLKKHLPVACMLAYKNVLTPFQAFKIPAPTLATFKKEYSEDWTTAYIAVWIININEYLNIARPMKDMQIEETAMLILQKYYYLKLSDINLIFTRMKTGEYGPLYEGLDGSKILKFFDKYAEERADLCYNETIREDEKLKLKEDFKRSSETKSLKESFSKANGFAELLKDDRIKVNELKINK
jgi:hypothetical protein